MAEPVDVFEIIHYMVIWRQEEPRTFDGVDTKINAIIRCLGDKKTGKLMEIFFLANGSEVPAPLIDLENGRAAMFMSIDTLQPFMDMLRNEKPIFGHIRGDRPEWTSVTTTEEPVGVGDEDF